MSRKLRRLFHKSIFGSFALRASAMALKSLQILILVRLYGAETFGVYSIALGVFTFSMVFARLGLDHLAQREAWTKDRTSYRHLLRVSRFLALPSLMAALIAQGIVWRFYDRPVALVFMVLVVAAPLYAISWNQIFVLRGSGRVNLSLVVFEIVNPLSLVSAALILHGSQLGLPLAFLFASIVTFVLTNFFVSRPPKELLETTGSPPSIRNSVVEARSFYVISILQSIQGLADGLAVGFFLRPIDATLYAIITRVAGLVLMPIAILAIYMNNLVARLRGEHLTEIWRQIRSYALASVFLSFALWTIMIVLLPYIGLIFGTRLPIDAQWTYVAVVTAQAFHGAAAPLNSALFMSGRESYITRIYTMLLPLYLFALVTFTPTHGILSVGLAFLSYSLAVIFVTAIVVIVKLREQRSSEI